MNDRPAIRFGVDRLTGNSPYDFLGWVTQDGFVMVEVESRTREEARRFRDLDFHEWQQNEKYVFEAEVKAGSTGATT